MTSSGTSRGTRDLEFPGLLYETAEHETRAAGARTWLLAFLLGGVLVAGAVLGLHVFGSAKAEQDAPDFTIRTLHHGNFTLSEQRGEIVVLDLMAVDCPTCRVTERSMLRLAEDTPTSSSCP
jgi:thiol:disulfide interchange protein